MTAGGSILVTMESAWARIHAEAPPVGLLDVTAPPAESTATHSDTDEQETPLRRVVPSTWATCHAEVPPVALVELSTFPPESTATHNDTDAHDTPLRAFIPSTCTLSHRKNRSGW